MGDQMETHAISLDLLELEIEYEKNYGKVFTGSLSSDRGIKQI